MIAPDAPFKGSDGLTVGDFWAWAFSDLLSNATRGIVAEFVVAARLGVHRRPRIEWDSHDLTYKGHGIEVKSAGYLQSWQHAAPSRIRFDVRARNEVWQHETNTWMKPGGRTAAVYVFCLFAEESAERANVLDLAQWEFYVISTGVLNAELGDQKSVGLTKLRKMTQPMAYDAVKAAVDRALTRC